MIFSFSKTFFLNIESENKKEKLKHLSSYDTFIWRKACNEKDMLSKWANTEKKQTNKVKNSDAQMHESLYILFL